jgi:hypothetical protein
MSILKVKTPPNLLLPASVITFDIRLKSVFLGWGEYRRYSQRQVDAGDSSQRIRMPWSLKNSIVIKLGVVAGTWPVSPYFMGVGTLFRQKHGATHTGYLLACNDCLCYYHGGNCNTSTEAAMFFRQKRSGDHVYLQIVENRWEKGGSKQRVVATVERLDQLLESGQLDGLLQSGANFAESVMVLAAHRQGRTSSIHTRRIGPAMGERLPEDQQKDARPSLPAARKTRSRRPCSIADAICSATWTSCSSTPRRSTSRAKAGRNWGNTGTARTTARTASR